MRCIAVIVIASLLLLQYACMDDNHGHLERSNGTSFSAAPLRILTVGANGGTRATETWVPLDWSGEGFVNSRTGSVVDHVSVTEFGQMTLADLQDNYDVVLTQWSSSGSLNLGTNSVLHNYVYTGGGLIVDGDYNNFNDLTWAGIVGATASCSATERNWILDTWYPGTSMLGQNLASDPELENCHGTFPSYDPNVLAPFLWDRNGNVAGLAGYHNKGKIVITGPDQDFHAHPVEHRDQFQLLLNEIAWAGQRPSCIGQDSILGVPASDFCNAFQYINCATLSGFDDTSTAYATQLYYNNFTGIPTTTEELFEGSRSRVSAKWVQNYELEYIDQLDTVDDANIDSVALEYLYSGAAMIPVERVNNIIQISSPSRWISRTALHNREVFRGTNYDEADRWIYQNPTEILPAAATRYSEQTLVLQLAAQVKCVPKIWDAVKACPDCNDLTSALSEYDIGRTFYVRVAQPVNDGKSFLLSKELKIMAIDTSGPLHQHAITRNQDFGGGATARWRMEISDRLYTLAPWADNGPVGVVFRTAP